MSPKDVGSLWRTGQSAGLLVGVIVEIDCQGVTESIKRLLELSGKQSHGPSGIDELLSMTMDQLFESSLFAPCFFTETNFCFFPKCREEVGVCHRFTRQNN